MSDLLDVVDENVSSEAPSEVQNEGSVESERPSWLPEKFKTPEDLVASYNELGKKIREKYEAPEKYEVPADLKFQAPDELLSAFKAANLTQEQASAALQAIDMTLIPAFAEAQKAAEINKLAQAWALSPESEEFEARRAKIARWAKENVDSAVVDVLRSSAEGVQALEKMMQDATRRSQTTSIQSAGTSVGLTMKDVNEMVADKRYGVDLEYTSWVERRVAEATKNGPLRN